jgi:hypothetical protein
MDIVLTAGRYINWGVVSISVTNLLVIVLMVVVFGLAIALPFPRERERRQAPQETPSAPPTKGPGA